MKFFSYDEITLIPKYSELESRSKADTSVSFLGKKWTLPVIPANMQDVIGLDNAEWLARHDYFYIMHRFGDIRQYTVGGGAYQSYSVGVKDEDKNYLGELRDDIPDYVTIDVAHAHHKNVESMVKFIQSLDPKPRAIIAGNVATSDGYKYLCDLGVNAVKVGIGGGSICTTKFKTGFHIPTAYSVWECSTNSPDYDTPIIADGGAKHFGDVAKALVLGATMVMSGRWFAECLDSPAALRGGKKIYRGSTSFEMKGRGATHIEGQTLEIDNGCTYEQRMHEIKQAFQSSISYAGGTTTADLGNVHWALV